MTRDLITPIRAVHSCPDCRGIDSTVRARKPSRPAPESHSASVNPWSALRGLLWYRGDLYLGALR